MALNSLTMTALAPNLQAVSEGLIENLSIQQNLPVKRHVRSEDISEASDYLVELKQVRDSGVKTAMLRELLDAEILFCSKKLKYSALVVQKRQMLQQLVEVHEQLRTTSRQVFQEQLQQMLTSLQGRLDRVSTDLAKAGLSKADVKLDLLECKEKVCSLIGELSDEESSASSCDESEDSSSSPSPWLKLCEASTGLDSHLSSLPLTDIEKYDWNQSEKFVKLYLDVPGLNEADQSKVSTSFGERNISVFVAGVAGRNHKLIVQDLNEPIDVSESKFRLKPERIVVFLKKKCSTTWTDITAHASAGRKQSVERLLKKMRVVFTEFVGLSALVEHLPPELRLRMLQESGCVVVDSADQAAHALQLVETELSEPPKLVLFKTRSTPSFDDASFGNALNALSDLDCYISFFNAQFENSSDVEEDDRLFKVLEKKPCTLVSFCGRLSMQCFSSLPAVLLELKLFIASAAELNALSEATITVDTLHVRVKTDMDLEGVQKFTPKAHVTPLHLVFHGLEDSNADWLIEAVRKILPYVDVRNVGTLLIPAWSLELLECRLSCAAHKRLLTELPVDVTAVIVHDRSGDPGIAGLASGYAARVCKFDLRLPPPK